MSHGDGTPILSMEPIQFTEDMFLFRDASIKAKNWTALAVKRGGEVRQFGFGCS